MTLILTELWDEEMIADNNEKRTAAEIIDEIKSLEKEGYNKEAPFCLPFGEFLELVGAVEAEVMS